MQHDPKIWQTKQTAHEGFLLLIRYPEIEDMDRLKNSFPTLAVITHELSEVSSNGLPEPSYNDALFEFDNDIRSAFEEKDVGQTVLIETFAGKRKYYIYVAPNVDLAEKVVQILKDYPAEHLTWSLHSDSEWNFINKYAKEFLN